MSTDYPVPLNLVQRRNGRYYAFDPKENIWYSMVSQKLKNGTRRLERNHYFNTSRQLWRPIRVFNIQPNVRGYAFFVDRQTIQAPGFTSTNTSYRNMPIVPAIQPEASAVAKKKNKNKKNKGSANLQTKSPTAKSVFFPKANIGGATRKRSTYSS